MGVNITPINHGTVEGDGTGDGAFDAFAAVNAADAALKAAVEHLQGRNWTLDNSARTLALGERVIAQSHAGIVDTLPATCARSATDYSDIWVYNADSAEDITLDPDGTDELFLNGVGQGAGVSVALSPGELAICSPRVTDVSWDVLILVSKGHSHTESDISNIGTHVHTFASLTSKPTTMSGYGISDSMVNFNTACSDGTFVFTGGAFHDGFSDYVAAEHINWTGDAGADNIHVNNITAVPAAAVTAHQAALSISWSQVTGTPTTLSGYAISDTKANYNLALSDGSFMYVGDAPTAHTVENHSDVTITTIAAGELLKWSGAAWINNTLAEAGVAAASHNHAWNEITSGVPTTLSGYGISDTKANFNTALSDGGFIFVGDAPTAHNHAWGDIVSGVPTTLSGYGISDSMANFNTACSDGTFVFTGGAFHDGFSDYVAGEHFLQSAISITLSQVSDSGALAALASVGAGNIAATFITGQTDMAAALVAADSLMMHDSGVGLVEVTLSQLDTYFNGSLSFGTVTEVTVGTGLDVATGTTTPDITLDLNELTAGGTPIGTDDIVFVDGTLTRKRQISIFPLGIFNNDQGWTANAGTVTAVTGGDGCSSSGGATPDIDIDAAQTVITSIYNAALKVGYSSTYHIDFSQTTHYDVLFNNVVEFRFENDGDFHADGNVHFYSATTASDRRLKKNLKPLENALDRVCALTGYTFNMKRDGFERAGLIAQEVQKVLGCAVVEVKNLKDDGYHLQLDNAGVMGLVVEAIKELKERIDGLTSIRSA